MPAPGRAGLVMARIQYTPPMVKRTRNAEPFLADFRDWSAFLTTCHAVPADSRIRAQVGWNGVASWDAGIALAEQGWAEGMEHVRAVSIPAVKNLVATRPQVAGWDWDVTGSAYDMGEYLSGTPECWATPQVEEAKPVIRIVVNLTTSGGVPQSIITMRGAGVVALTLALQTAGYVVDVAALVGLAPNYNQSYWARIPLSDAQGGPLDVDRLVYALAHPSSPRLLGYSCGYHACAPGEYIGLGGWAQCAPPWDADLYLGHAFLSDADWGSAASVSTWVQRMYDRLVAGETIHN